MPIKYVIAKSYTDEQDDSTEQRIFHPRNASETDFREFMVNMYQTQQAANVDLVRLVGAQESMIKELFEKCTALESENSAAHVHRDAEISDLKDENSGLRTQLGELKETVSKLNTQYDFLYDRSLDQERHSMGFNLRFPNIPECTTREARGKEDCISKIKEKLELVGLGHVTIENARRVGGEPPNPDRPRGIIARFLYRPERKLIMNKRKELFLKKIPVFEDLCKPDRDRKAKYAEVIKQHYNAGKKTWFSRGFYYVDSVKQVALV